MNQLDWCTADLPRSRRRDPMTSRLAAQRVAPYLNEQQQQTMAAVRALDTPSTATEIGAKWADMQGVTDGMERHKKRQDASRRLPELADKHLVRRCPPRVCTVSGSPQTTWRAV